jgi:hypothetical protein
MRDGGWAAMPREGHDLGRAAQPKKECGFQPLRFASAWRDVLRVLNKDDANLRRGRMALPLNC